MRTKFALAFYYLAIGFLTAVACVIVVKLIFWPPCTQTGNSCVIDPWSAAGLEATVLGVSATVLAILGAVAVAGWWTTLNTRVKDQVDTLYEAQKAEVNTRVDALLKEQQEKVADQLNTVQTKVQEAESRISQATKDIDELEELTRDFLDIAVDGIILNSVDSPEEWAQKVAALHKFPRVPLTMAMRYLSSVEDYLAQAEQQVLDSKDQLAQSYEEYKQLNIEDGSVADLRSSSYSSLNVIFLKTHVESCLYLGHVKIVLKSWERLLYWREVASQDAVDIEVLNEKISAYQFRIDQLRLHYTQVKEQGQPLLDHIKNILPPILNEREDTTDTAQQP